MEEIKQNFSSFFYFNPSPSWAYDMRTFQILDVNQAALDHYGYTRDEFLEMSIKDVWLKEEFPKLLELHTDLGKHEGNIYFGIFTHQKKNGDLIRLKINGHKQDYLAMDCMMMVGQDVTMEEYQYKLLQESEERLKTVSVIAKIGYWRLDVPTRKLSWTDEVYSIWGRSKNEFELHVEHFYNSIHPDEREAFENEQKASLAGQKDLDFKYRIILPDKSIKWVHELGRLVKDEQGMVVAFEGTVQDITKEKKIRELNRQASKLARIGSWEVDVLGEKLYWSEMVHQLHETNPKTFIPDLQSALDFYREDFRLMATEAVQKCIETGAEFDFEAVLVTENKKERWVRAIGNVELVDGKCQRVYGSFQDIHAFKSLELQIREILESISDAFYAVDKDWNFTYFNKEAVNLLLKQAEDVLGKNIWELFPAGKNTPVQEIYERVARSENPESFEYFYPGDGKWYEINAYPSNGGVSAYFRNIDERKQAVERLEKAYQEKNSILESIGDAFFSVTKDWIVTYWNKEAEKILGKRRDAIIGKNLWEEYADAIETDFYRQYHQAMKTQENLAFEEYYSALNKWVEVVVYPSTTGLSVYFKDITQRKESNIRLLQANERFEKVTEVTHDAIWDWNILENTLYLGAGFKDLFGYQFEKITPTLESWTNYIHPEDRERMLQSIYEALEKPDQSNWIAEYRYQKNDATFADVIDRGMVIRDERGNPIRMVGAMNDITERKNFEISRCRYVRQIEIQNEKLKNIAWTQSHIVRAPLARMLGIMNVIEDNEESLDDTLMWLKHLRDSANELDDITKNIVKEAQHLNLT